MSLRKRSSENDNRLADQEELFLFEWRGRMEEVAWASGAGEELRVLSAVGAADDMGVTLREISAEGACGQSHKQRSARKVEQRGEETSVTTCSEVPEDRDKSLLH